jgi:hypothetical protein
LGRPQKATAIPVEAARSRRSKLSASSPR